MAKDELTSVKYTRTFVIWFCNRLKFVIIWKYRPKAIFWKLKNIFQSINYIITVILRVYNSSIDFPFLFFVLFQKIHPTSYCSFLLDINFVQCKTTAKYHAVFEEEKFSKLHQYLYKWH